MRKSIRTQLDPVGGFLFEPDVVAEETRSVGQTHRLTLVARRLVPSQNDQSTDVTGDAQHVKHGQQRL